MTQQGSYSWPKSMPKNCPLSGNTTTVGIFYRVVYKNPPDADDFLMSIYDPNQKHLQLKERFGKLSSNKKCEAFSTSHFDSLDKCMRIAICKKRTADVKIAELNLQFGLGVMKQTGSPNHYSVWFDMNAQPWNCIVNIHPVQVT